MDHWKQKLNVRHSANVQDQRPNFFIADFSALADSKRFDLGHSLGQETLRSICKFMLLGG